ncbi:SDR family oxidoreductase [Micromonospora sp. WMMD736]|uniref:SDR family oxidoreductase n=1 Tax=Micromonospora sp. WMMD736 TaxID=3404112 RepID=UPI003B95FF52
MASSSPSCHAPKPSPRSALRSTVTPLASGADLEETVRLVEKSGRRVIASQVDVRDRVGLQKALDDAVAELGGLHVIVANAAICPLGNDVPVQGFIDAFDVDFIGVVNTVHVGLPHLGECGSVIITGSVAGLVPQAGGVNGQGGLQGPGGDGYGLAKKMVRDYTRSLALSVGPSKIRVNAIHPTNVDADMLPNPAMYKTFRPDLADPTRTDAEVTFPFMQAMPIPYVEPADISHAVVYLASDESRYVTGQQLFVDAGASLKLGI